MTVCAVMSFAVVVGSVMSAMMTGARVRWWSGGRSSVLRRGQNGKRECKHKNSE
jgi:hypothetical protein